MRCAIPIAAALAGLAGGCFQSESVSQPDLARCWYLQDDLWQQAEPGPLSLGPWALPGKWTFRQEPSVIWATVSIVRAIDALQQGAAQDIEIDVSPTHTEIINLLLTDARRAVEDLRAMSATDSPVSADLWATRVAGALVAAERVVRGVGERTRGADGRERASPLGWSAGPLLEFVSAYLDTRAGGLLLQDLGDEEVKRLRVVLTQILLRLSFAVRGRRDPPGLRASLVAEMRAARRPSDLEAGLRGALSKALDTAPPARAGSELAEMLADAVDVAPSAIELLQSFFRQWDRMESLTLEIRRLGEKPVVGVTFRLRPNREIRLARLFPMQPTILIRGGCRVVVQPAHEGRNENAVLFEPIGDGRAEIRFEGLGYAIIRLLGLPLADARLREVRLMTLRAPAGLRQRNVALVMEAGGSSDPRRLLAYRETRRPAAAQSAAGAPGAAVRKERVLTYLTPTRRYVYRISDGAD